MNETSNPKRGKSLPVIMLIAGMVVIAGGIVLGVILKNSVAIVVAAIIGTTLAIIGRQYR